MRRSEVERPGWTPLWRIVGLWRAQWPAMLAGIAVTLLAVLAGLAVMAGVATHLARLAARGSAGIRIALPVLVLATPALLRLTGLGRVALRYIERLLTHAVTFRALAGLRVWLFRGVARSAAGGLGFLRSGDLLSRLVGDVDTLDGLYLRLIVPLWAALLAGGVMIAALAALGAPPALIASIAVLFAIAALIWPALAARQGLRSGPVLTRAASELRVAVLDLVVGLREIRVFGAEGRMRAAIQARESTLLAAQARLSGRLAMASVAAFVCAQGVMICLLAAALGWSPFVSGHGAAPVAMLAALFVAIAAFESVSGLPRAGVLAGQMTAAAARVIDAASQPPPVAEPTQPETLPARFDLAFEQVDFRWQPDRPPVFDGLSLEIAAGRRVAILGPSGAGKSSLAALAMRLGAPQSGRILLGGVPIERLSVSELRTRFAWLGQQTHLFADTIAANLRLQRPDASDAELWAALAQAGVDAVVRSLPGDLDSWLGEGGASLSGGQQRRIALARVLLSRAPILILDEPCAGLDTDTERAFLDTLNRIGEGRTVILIVHRLLGVERLDRIWRLAGGRATAATA